MEQKATKQKRKRSFVEFIRRLFSNRSKRKMNKKGIKLSSESKNSRKINKLQNTADVLIPRRSLTRPSSAPAKLRRGPAFMPPESPAASLKIRLTPDSRRLLSSMMRSPSVRMCCIAANDDDNISQEEKQGDIGAQKSTDASCESIASQSTYCIQDYEELPVMDDWTDVNYQTLGSPNDTSKWATSRAKTPEGHTSVSHDTYSTRAHTGNGHRITSRNNPSLTMIQNYVTDAITSESEMGSSEDLSIQMKQNVRRMESSGRHLLNRHQETERKENVHGTHGNYQTDLRVNVISTNSDVFQTGTPKTRPNVAGTSKYMCPEMTCYQYPDNNSTLDNESRLAYSKHLSSGASPSSGCAKSHSFSGSKTHSKSNITRFPDGKQFVTVHHGHSYPFPGNSQQFVSAEKVKMKKNEMNEIQKRQKKYRINNSVGPDREENRVRYVTQVNMFAKKNRGPSTWLSVPVKETAL